MKIKKHIVMLKERDYKLWDYIQSNHIPYKETESLVVLDIYTESEHWHWIQRYVEECSVFCTSDTDFSKEELQEAQWMRVRSTWLYDYPQPSNGYGYKDITYMRSMACPECAAGHKQVAPFRMKKAPSWGRRHFFSVNWVFDELFASDTVKDVFQKEGISGVSFWDVLNKSGSRLEGVNQMYISHMLPPAFVESDVYLKQTTICPVCGTKKYCCNGCGKHQYRGERFQNIPDIVKTGDYFGGMSGIADPDILINQKTYQIIVRYKLEKSLIFEPIDLI